MAIDPNDPRRFYPDFQADTRPPQWIPMGDDQDQGMGQNIAAIGGAFKNRFMNQPAASHADALPHGGMGGPTLAPHEEMPVEAPLHGTTGTGKPGGFKSL